MKKKINSKITPDEVIINKIYFIRGEKVMLDKDLAELYDVPTKSLNLAVKRNLKRFPKDFMFQLTERESKNLKFQFETSSLESENQNWGGSRKLPKVFTEQGVAMLSSVLNSDCAIETNIRIIRIFTKLRSMLLTHKDILLKLEQLEKQVVKNSDDVRLIFHTLRQLINPQQARKRIGFKRKNES
jgi:hypothetical protein